MDCSSNESEFLGLLFVLIVRTNCSNCFAKEIKAVRNSFLLNCICNASSNHLLPKRVANTDGEAGRQRMGEIAADGVGKTTTIS